MKQKFNIKFLRTRKDKKHPDQVLSVQLKELLGEEILTLCWQDTIVNKSRLIRHAIVHNNRKINDVLGKKFSEEELPRTEENEIIIYPTDTTNLYNNLKERVYKFCETIISIS